MIQKEPVCWSAVVASLIYFGLGLVLILRPHDSSLFLCYIVGIALTGYGLFHLISYFRNVRKTGAVLLIGVLSTAFGIYTLFRPTAIQGILFITLGILIVLNSLSALRQATLLKALSFHFWWIPALYSLFITLLGFVIIFNYEWFGDFLMFLTGMIMMLEAISNFWLMHRIHLLEKNK